MERSQTCLGSHINGVDLWPMNLAHPLLIIPPFRLNFYSTLHYKVFSQALLKKPLL